MQDNPKMKYKTGMKNYLIILISCFLSMDVNAQLRHCDVAVDFHTPKDGDTLVSVTSIKYSFWVINHGEDSLYASDSISYSVSLNFLSEDKTLTRRELGLGVPPGDSLLFEDELIVDEELSQERMSLIFHRRAKVYSYAGSKQFLLQEVHPGTVNNIDQVDIILLKSKVSVPHLDWVEYDVFPNPVVAGYPLTITSSHSNTKVYLYDAQGRKVRVDDTKKSGSKISINIPYGLQGLYYLVLSEGSNTRSKKIIIE